jgi:type IV secretory pathway TraG/TraD family ATPase VirD4
MVDLARKGFLKQSDDGIVVGQQNGKLLRLAGQQFVILAAPTRSGKGIGVVIPNLLDYRESAVVLDIKQENFDLTSGWRRSIGHEVYLFNPFAEDRRSHRWNPMTYVSDDPSFRVSDLQAIAAMLYPDGDNEVLEKRALMLPQELKAMGPEKEIVLYEGLAHPVLCRKIRYYKDRYFTGRLLPAVEIRPLGVGR